MVMGLNQKQFRMVGTLLIATLIVVLNQTFLSPALPSIMVDMQVDQTTVQWLASGYAMVEAVVIPMSAYLMGRFSTRRLFLSGMGLFAAGSALAIFAPNFGLLLLGRMMQAVCTGAIMPMAATLTLISFPRERRGFAMGIIGLIIGFAPAIGPSLSGFLVDVTGWRMLFIIIASLAVIMIIIGALWLPNHDEFERVHFDLTSVILSSIGLGMVLYALSSFTSSEHIWIQGIIFVVGLAIVFFYVRRQLTIEHPMLRINILKTKRYRYNVIIVAMMQAALMATGVILPILLQTLMGYSALATGLIMLPGAIIGAVCGVISGKLFDKFGVRKIAIPGIIVVCIGAIGHIGFSMHASIAYIIFWYTFLGLGLQFTFPPLNTWGINSLDNALIQHAQSVSNTINQIGGATGTALLVSISALGAFAKPELAPLEQMSFGVQIAFFTMTIILFVCLFMVIFLTRDKVAPDKIMSVGESDGFNADKSGATARKEEQARIEAENDFEFEAMREVVEERRNKVHPDDTVEAASLRMDDFASAAEVVEEMDDPQA